LTAIVKEDHKKVYESKPEDNIYFRSTYGDKKATVSQIWRNKKIWTLHRNIPVCFSRLLRAGYFESYVRPDR